LLPALFGWTGWFPLPSFLARVRDYSCGLATVRARSRFCRHDNEVSEIPEQRDRISESRIIYRRNELLVFGMARQEHGLVTKMFGVECPPIGNSSEVNAVGADFARQVHCVPHLAIIVDLHRESEFE